jgi:hypothetical protein
VGGNGRRYRDQPSCDGMFVGFEAASSGVIETLSRLYKQELVQWKTSPSELKTK